MDDNALFENEEALLKCQNIPFIHDEYTIGNLIHDIPFEKPKIISKLSLQAMNDVHHEIKKNKNYGLITCIATNDCFVAVGTTRDVLENEMHIILHFEPDCKLLKLTAGFSGVSCMAISPNSQFLAHTIKNMIGVYRLSNLKNPHHVVVLSSLSNIYQINFGNNSNIGFAVTDLHQGVSFNTR
ncbi:hypothetical protein MXB_1065 [Myxobolus squamalis]|nr:hypothetical protein MXB_1065 [Myxobolus squamalis]